MFSARTVLVSTTLVALAGLTLTLLFVGHANFLGPSFFIRLISCFDFLLHFIAVRTLYATKKLIKEFPN